MNQSRSDLYDRLLSLPVGRRTVLYLGMRSALNVCAAVGLFETLSGCYRAPGTARDQLIFLSEEKEIAMGVSAYREVLRQTRLNENPEKKTREGTDHHFHWPVRVKAAQK